MADRRRRRPEEWQALIRAFQDSGQNTPVFCEAKGLNQAYFVKQLRRHRQSSTPQAFVAAKPKVASPMAVSLQVGRATIQLPANVSTTWLADLVQRLA